MTLEQGDELIALVDRGPWRTADPDIRFTVLPLVDGSIAHLRERHGLAPFDDSLDDDPLTVFQIVRGMLA